MFSGAGEIVQQLGAEHLLHLLLLQGPRLQNQQFTCGSKAFVTPILKILYPFLTLENTRHTHGAHTYIHVSRTLIHIK